MNENRAVISAYELLPLAEAYITDCASGNRIPNIAGFYRFLGISATRFAEIAEAFPEEAAQIRDVFEDEAINSEMPPSLLGSYLKSRLGYGEAHPEKHDTEEPEQTRIIFEHDILRDGG